MAVFILSYGAPAKPAATVDHATNVARTSRAAGLQFLEGVRRGWGKRETADWLLGAYSRATSFEREPRGELETRLEAHPRPIDEEVFDELLSTVRANVTSTLDMIVRSPLRPWFVDHAIERGHVVPSSADGLPNEPASELWVARDRPGMHLDERVLSLFACDYLARPASYDRELFVCGCDAVGFDREARDRGTCSTHDRSSGVVASRNGVDPKDDDFEPITQPLPFLLKTRKASSR